jgi:hypothetical protein
MDVKEEEDEVKGVKEEEVKELEVKDEGEDSPGGGARMR